MASSGRPASCSAQSRMWQACATARSSPHRSPSAIACAHSAIASSLRPWRWRVMASAASTRARQPRGRVAGHVRERPQRAQPAAHRLRRATGAVGELGLAQQHLAGAERVAGGERAGAAVGSLRRVGTAAARLRLSERDPGVRDVVADGAGALRGVERAPEQQRGVGVRALRAGALRRLARIVPGAPVVAGAEEVQREDARALAGRAGALGLQLRARVGMQPPARLERQPGVGGLAHDPAAEPEPAAAVLGEDVAEPRERLAVVERARVEAHAEHRGVAHERAVARVEPVDPRGGGGLQRLGQRVVAGRGGGEQVAQELRVAGRAVRRRARAPAAAAACRRSGGARARAPPRARAGRAGARSGPARAAARRPTARRGG